MSPEEELKHLTPTNDELLELARRHPPAQEWYDDETEHDWAQLDREALTGEEFDRIAEHLRVTGQAST